MVLVKTIAVFFITGLVAIIFIPAGCFLFLVSLFGLARPVSFLIYKFAQAWARLIIALTACTMIVTGRENIPKKGGVCFVSNHVGIFDIILALSYAGRPFGFIAKKELAFVPGIDLWILLLGGLFIDRKRPRKAVKTIAAGIKRIKTGGGMLIFPEGTRSRGRGLGPFLPGALKLATQSGALIVPIAITGSYEVFEKNYRVNAVPVHVSFLPPIRSSDLPPEDRKQILAERIHTAIGACQELHSSRRKKRTHTTD